MLTTNITALEGKLDNQAEPLTQGVSIIDSSPMLPFHWRLVLQSAGGPFLDGWLLSIIGVALIGMTPALGLSGTDLSAGAAALIGIFFGGLVFGRLTDVVGRS